MTANKIATLALVTGASSGIGKAFARALAAGGTDLVLVARDEARLAELATELRDAHGRDVEVLPAVLIDDAQLRRVADRLKDEPAIDLLVNNAGFGDTGAFADLPSESGERQIRLNVLALTVLAHAAATTMKKARRGGIINVASGAAFFPNPGIAVYGATKAYVTSLSQALHEELAGADVKVTVVCPGFTRTEFQQRAKYDASGVPSMLWQSAESVVEATLAAYVEERSLCIPGMHNKIMGSITQLVPRSLLGRVAGLVSQRMGGA
jgi:short-subunit dehydrogenase